MDRLDVHFSSNGIFQTLESSSAVNHVMGTSSSLIVSTSAVFRTILGTVSYVITSLTTLILPMATHLQRTGETLLAVVLLLSAVQALVAMYQYRYDTRGQLIFPDGLTFGKEDCFSEDKHTTAVGITGDSEDDRIGKRDGDSATPLNNTDASLPLSSATRKVNTAWATEVVKRLNKSLVLLLPWITRNVHNLLTKNTHLFHIGFIVFMLDSILPFILDGEISASDKLNPGEANASGKKESFDIVHFGPGTASLLKKMNKNKELYPYARKDPIRILVIGDSLAIGTGCIEQFDAEKDNSVPMALIENTSVLQTKTKMQAQHSCQGPVFPQVLASSLSRHFQQPVQWRSAGVDGGDVNDIRSYCMDVVKKESATGNSTIDIIVVLFGMNDLKKLVAVNPIQHLFHSHGETQVEGGITSRFRHGQELLLSEIRSITPDTLVVFPALPIQPFHKNSIINIFPLGLMVDATIGVWERQKKIVASRRDNVMYVELKAKEIADWYSSNGISSFKNQLNNPIDEHGFNINGEFDDIKGDVLLSADGVHPNKRMYSKWAELVGDKLYNQIVMETKEVERNNCQTPKDFNDIQMRTKELAKGYVTDKNRT